MGVAYVTLSDSNQVVLIDTTTHALAGAIDVGASGCNFPWRATMSPDAAHVYVSCFHSSSVIVIDTASNTVVTNIPSVSSADDITFVQGGSYALVGSRHSPQITIIDTAVMSVTGIINTPANTRSLSGNPYTNQAYVTAQNGNILVIDTNTFTIVDTIAVGGDPWDVALSPDNQRVYAGDRWGAGLHVIDANTNTLLTTITGVGDLTGLAITPDSQTLYAGALSSGVNIFDLPSLTHIGTVGSIGTGWATAVNCDGSEVYVGNTQATVPIIDTQTNTLLIQVSVLSSATRGIAICPEHILNDVTLLPPLQTNSGALGDVVTHQLTLFNASQISDSYTVTLGANTWNTALSVGQVGPLLPQESITFTVNVTVPIGADWYDSDAVTIYATSVTSPSVLSDTAVATTQAYAPANLSFNPTAVSHTQQVNVVSNHAVTISNGNGVTGTFELRLTGSIQSLAVAGSGSYDFHNWLSGQPELSQYTFTNIGNNWTSAELLPYDGVLVSECDNCLTTTESAALRQFYEAGHAVLLGMDDMDESPTAVQNDVYAIFGVSNAADGNMDPPITVNQNHPIGQAMTTTINFYGSDNDHYQENGATWIAQGSDGYYYVLAYDGGAHSIIFGENMTEWYNDSPSLVSLSIQWLNTVSSPASWFQVTPISGTVATDSNQQIQVDLDSNALQPGIYTEDLTFQTNDPQIDRFDLPLTLTVQPSAIMGWVEGVVTDSSDSSPLEATIIAQGQPYTITADSNTGYYKLWLDQGSHTLQVSADGYVTQTRAVNITSQQGQTEDFALVLDVPVLQLTHDNMFVSQNVGQTANRTLTVTNAGPAPLDFKILKTAAGYVPYSYIRNKLNLTAVSDFADSSLPATGPLADSKTAVQMNGNPVLVFQDSYPWGYDSIQQVLNANGIAYDQVNSNSMATIDLSAYELIIIPSVQYSNYYNNWNMNFNRFEDYVNDGGALWLSATNGGSLSLPGGIVNQYGPDDYNDIIAPNHPWVANVPSQIVGTSASYNYFTNVPPDAQVVAESTSYNQATLIDYRLGVGRIMLTSQPLEFAWYNNWDFAPILENTLLDMHLWQPGGAPWLQTQPVSGTVAGYSATAVQVIFDAAGLQPGNYTADLIISTNDLVTPQATIPVTMVVSPTSGMGQVSGTITDLWTGDPLTATIQMMGVYTATDVTNYTIWADAGSQTLLAYAAGYMTATHTVNIPADGSIVQDIALEPAQPRLEGLPISLTVTTVPDVLLTQNVSVSNTGPLPLDYEWHEIDPMLAATKTVSDLSGKVILYDRAHGQPDIISYSEMAQDIVSGGGQINFHFSGLITEQLLAGVDVLWLNGGYTSWTFAEQLAVLNWADAGGAVLIHGDSNSSNVDAAAIFNIYYDCCYYTSGSTSDIMPHPTTAGISSIYLNNPSRALTTTQAAVHIVKSTDLQTRAVAQETAGSKVVVISDYMFSDNVIDNDDNRLFASNIMNWLADPAYGDLLWLATSPVSGTISAYDFQDTMLTIDSTGWKVGDTVQATLALEHNDPDQLSPILIPMTVNVADQAAAVSLTSGTSSGNGLPGSWVTYTLTIQNLGNGPDTFDITVSSIWPATSEIGTTDQLMPGQSKQFKVSVQVPGTAAAGESDTATIIAESQFDTAVSQSVSVTTNVISTNFVLSLPVIMKP
ncbi:MAG: hypothetical protein GY796_13720 [Chloroflexi bacterium]|nr:hypothetical protein [Chloroflexota bacterium]